MALLDKPWLAAAALATVSATVLLTAFLMGHFAGHVPCELCWYQRYARVSLHWAATVVHIQRVDCHGVCKRRAGRRCRAPVQPQLCALAAVG